VKAGLVQTGIRQGRPRSKKFHGMIGIDSLLHRGEDGWRGKGSHQALEQTGVEINDLIQHLPPGVIKRGSKKGVNEGKKESVTGSSRWPKIYFFVQF